MTEIMLLMGVFAKVALGAFGGGLAMIPFIHHELVVVHPWLTDTMFREVISLAQMTPGPIALNAATFVGYRMAGFWGSFFATVALAGTPILVIAALLLLMSWASGRMRNGLDRFQKALRPAVAGMLVSAFWTLASPLVPRNFESWAAMRSSVILLGFVALCLLLLRRKLFRDYPQLLILVSALAGLCFTGYL